MPLTTAICLREGAAAPAPEPTGHAVRAPAPGARHHFAPDLSVAGHYGAPGLVADAGYHLAPGLAGTDVDYSA